MTTTAKNLPESDQVKIKELLGSTPMNKLRRVILGLRDVQVIIAGEDKIIAKPETQRDGDAEAAFVKAKRYQTCIEVLAELDDMARNGTPFSTVEIKPTVSGEIEPEPNA